MITTIQVAASRDTNISVSSEMFGANVVYGANTTGGNVHATLTASADALGISHVRFPGGRGDNADATTEGAEWLNIVSMPGGELRPELTDFLDWCIATGSKATLVIPTKFLDAQSYVAFGDDIRAFAAEVIAKYGQVLAAFEIGNEYWEMGETAYAAKANIALDALALGAEDIGMEATDRPQMLVQMATPNTGSEFHVDAAGMEDFGYTQRLDMANNRIIDLLTDRSKGLIDGVVEHYYYARNALSFTGHSDEVNYIDRDFANWQARFEKPLDLHITEWNVKTTNITENGIRSASTLIEQVARMVEMGVDAASVWAVQHNTVTDLTGNSGDPVLVDANGRVVNTVRGAAFDMLATSIQGLNLVDLGLANMSDGAAVHAFAGLDQVVIYVSSRSLETMNVRFEPGDLDDGFGHLSGLKLGYDPTSADGRHFDPNARAWETVDSLDLNGDGTADYFINEHDVRARFTGISANALWSDGALAFELKPFEVMQLVFSRPVTEPVRLFRGDQSADVIFGTESNDTIRGMAGPDSLNGGLGHDKVFGGRGMDRLTGAQGNDRLEGQAGDDVLFGNQGRDTVLGGVGADIMRGGCGRDVLNGGAGADRLLGNPGDDSLVGGKGRDCLNGGSGNDTLTGGAGRDVFVFTAGNDRIADFSTADILRLDSGLVSGRDALERAIAEAEIHGDDLVLAFGPGNSVTLEGMTDLSLLADRTFLLG